MSDKLNERSQNSISDAFEKSAFAIAIDTVKRVYKKNKKIMFIEIILSFFISAYVSGRFQESIYIGQAVLKKHNLINTMICGVTDMLVVTLVLFCLINYLALRACIVFYKDIKMDEENEIEIAKNKIHGKGEKMGDEEKKEAFNNGDYLSMKANIVGSEPKEPEKLYSIRPDYGINDNVLVVGAPGAGKSRCICIDDIMQTVRRRESMIITDPKGELYSKTAEMARAHGYTVKILNLHPKRMLHSDTCNYMSVITDDLMAMSFAKTIVLNTSDGTHGKDFWSDSELNLLTACALYIRTNEIGLPKTLGGIYQLLNTNTVNSLEEQFENLPDMHPAKAPFRTYQNGDNTVKGNTLAGLCIRLQVLSNPLVQIVTGEDDIDFTLPGREPCLYFIGMSDMDSSMSFLVALFFSLLYQELVGYADEHGGHLPVKVTMLLDEFKNIGVIPEFDKKLSVVRSRGIDSIMILQDLAQLQEMFPENTSETIINDCSTYILLRTNSILTAKYFSDRSGDMTVLDKSKKYSETAGDLLKVHPEYMISETKTNRVVFTPHDVLTLNKNHMMVVVSSHNVAELAKIDYSNHPMCKEIREVSSSKHRPAWVDNLSQAEWDMFEIRENEYELTHPIDKKNYSLEGELPIELCTDEDFMEPWNKEKEFKLQEIIAKQKYLLSIGYETEDLVGVDYDQVEVPEKAFENINDTEYSYEAPEDEENVENNEDVKDEEVDEYEEPVCEKHCKKYNVSKIDTGYDEEEPENIGVHGLF